MSDQPLPSKPLRLVVLISGGGSTLANLIHWVDSARIRNAQIVGVVSSRRKVKGNQIALDAGLKLQVVHPHDHASDNSFSQALAEEIDILNPDLVVMGGFLRLWRFPPHYGGRVLNIHPALLPQYGGAGMFGSNVHRAVLAAGETHSGCTVHLVDHQYDHGPVVAQARVSVNSADRAEDLAARVMAAERWLYPWVLGQVAEHGVQWLQQSTADPIYFESSPFEASSASEDSSS